MLTPSLIVLGSGIVAIAALKAAVQNPKLALVVGIMGGLAVHSHGADALPAPLAAVAAQVESTSGVLDSLRSITERPNFQQADLADHEMAGQYYQTRTAYSTDMNDANDALRAAFGNVTG